MHPGSGFLEVGVAQSCLAQVPIACRSGSSVLSLLVQSLPETLFGVHAQVSLTCSSMAQTNTELYVFFLLTMSDVPW